MLAKSTSVLIGMQLALLIGFSAAALSEPQVNLGQGSNQGMMVWDCSSKSDQFLAWLAMQIVFIG